MTSNADVPFTRERIRKYLLNQIEQAYQRCVFDHPRHPDTPDCALCKAAEVCQCVWCKLADDLEDALDAALGKVKT
jgi:putative ribosome biogenesis GTPase RsgA